MHALEIEVIEFVGPYRKSVAVISPRLDRVVLIDAHHDRDIVFKALKCRVFVKFGIDLLCPVLIGYGSSRPLESSLIDVLPDDVADIIAGKSYGHGFLLLHIAHKIRM